jgi:hypothetical protein
MSGSDNIGRACSKHPRASTHGQRPDQLQVTANGGKVAGALVISNTVLAAHLLHHGGNSAQMAVVEPREEMVLHLQVQPAAEPEGRQAEKQSATAVLEEI